MLLLTFMILLRHRAQLEKLDRSSWHTRNIVWNKVVCKQHCYSLKANMQTRPLDPSKIYGRDIFHSHGCIVKEKTKNVTSIAFLAHKFAPFATLPNLQQNSENAFEMGC